MSHSSAQSLKLSPGRARALVTVAYVGLLAGFAIDLFIDPQPRALALAVPLLKLVGLVGCLAIFSTTFSFTANAPDHEIDERERAERNAAYVRAYQVVITAVFLLFLTTIGLRLLTEWTPTVSMLEDLLTVIGVGGLALPAAILAWRAAGDDEDR